MKGRKRKNEAHKKRSLLFGVIILGLAGLVGAPLVLAQEGKVPVSARQPVDFSAFAQIRYTQYSAEGTDTFSLRRVRLAFSAAVLNNLDFKVQVEQTKSIGLVEAYFSYHLGQWAEIRAGQFKIPFSYENLTSASAQDFINRSSVIDTLCPGRDIGSQGRDIGAMVMLHNSFFEGAFGLFNGAGINRLDNDDHKDKAFRVTITPWRGLTLGGSWYDGLWPEKPEVTSRLRRRQGLEGQLRSGSFVLCGEYIRARNYDQEASGWVAQVSLFLRQGLLQPVLRFESLDRDRSLPDDEEEVWTYGLNIHLGSRTKLQLNQESHQLKGENKKNKIYLLQFQVGF